MEVGIPPTQVMTVPVDNHAHVDQDLDATLCKTRLFVWSQFCGEAELNLSTDLGVLPLLSRFG